MPLQWLPLDQSIYNKSPISEAIRGGQSGGQPKAPSRQFLGTQDTTNYALERMKQEWAMEDKKKKEERNAAMERAQELGLRLQAALNYLNIPMMAAYQKPTDEEGNPINSNGNTGLQPGVNQNLINF